MFILLRPDCLPQPFSFSTTLTAPNLSHTTTSDISRRRLTHKLSDPICHEQDPNEHHRSNPDAYRNEFSNDKKQSPPTQAAWRRGWFCLCGALRQWCRGNICIDYNTTSAGLSSLGATPAAPLSGRQIPSSTSITKARPLRSTLPNSGSPQNGQLTCTDTVRPPRKPSLVTLESLAFSWQTKRRKEHARRNEATIVCLLLVFCFFLIHSCMTAATTDATLRPPCRPKSSILVDSTFRVTCRVSQNFWSLF